LSESTECIDPSYNSYLYIHHRITTNTPFVKEFFIPLSTGAANSFGIDEVADTFHTKSNVFV
jgi:hypothetical protein